MPSLPRLNLLPMAVRGTYRGKAPNRRPRGNTLTKEDLEYVRIRKFWSKVDKKGPLWNGSHCWIWKGITSKYGYSVSYKDGRTIAGHRVSFTLLNGPIPSDKQIDHLCRNRLCVNPSHLELVTAKENVLRGVGITAMSARKTHCLNGHELSEGNIYSYRGSRMCKMCMYLRQKERRRLQKEAKCG